MAQHQRITLARVESILSKMSPLHKEAIADLLRVMVRVDVTLVKHDHTALAREIRKAFDRLEDLI